MFYLIISDNTHLSCKDTKYQYLSFSKGKEGICFGHTKPLMIPNYSLHDYIMEYGHEIVGSFKRDAENNLVPIKVTILEYLKQFIPTLSRYRLGNIKNGFVYYSDFDKCRASEHSDNESILRHWAKNNGIVLTN